MSAVQVADRFECPKCGMMVHTIAAGIHRTVCPGEAVNLGVPDFVTCEVCGDHMPARLARFHQQVYCRDAVMAGSGSALLHKGASGHNHKMRPLVIIESPFAGDVATHVAYAKRAVRDCLSRGEAPIASHLLFTQPGMLDDDVPEQREAGMEAGWAWYRAPAASCVVYADYGTSKGMAAGIDRAIALGRPVFVRRIGRNVVGEV